MLFLIDAKPLDKYITPYINTCPWQISRMVNIKASGATGQAIAAGSNFTLARNSGNWVDAAFYTTLGTTHAVSCLQSIGQIPPTPKRCLAINCLEAVGTVLGASHGIYDGVGQMRSKDSFISFGFGASLATCGAINLTSLFLEGYNCFNGYRKGDLKITTDPMVLRHKITFVSTKPKKLNAVFICTTKQDATSDTPNPLVKSIYDTCNTLSYKVKSADDLNQTLQKATTHFKTLQASNGKVDLLCFSGHGNSQLIELDATYHFTATPNETLAIQSVLNPKAQVFYLSCKTASKNPGGLNVTERLANALPHGIEVTGFTKNYYPPFTTTSLIKGRFKHENYRPEIGNNWPINSTVTLTSSNNKISPG